MLHSTPSYLTGPGFRVIATFTDFSNQGPYLGQVKAVLQALVPDDPVVDVFPDLPACNVKAAAYLLPAYIQCLRKGCICLCVVDPGVGTGRRALALNIDERWYVGPDNGLFSMLVRRAEKIQAYEITWQPDRLSNSFHGRDLFAPVCGMLSRGDDTDDWANALDPDSLVIPDWPEDLFEVIYIDNYGNLITGVRASVISEDVRFEIGGWQCAYQRVFAEAPDSAAFWYENANGLVEIAIAGSSAQDLLGINTGDELRRVR